MKIRMAMDKIKQALGIQISDAQLLDLLRGDMEASDPGGEAYGAYGDLRAQPIFEDLDEYPADEIAEAVQQMQGGLASDQSIFERMYGYDPRF